MENSKRKKKSKDEQKSDSASFVHALRSSGLLMPVTDEEVKSFDELHGELNEELPERFKNLDFIFKNTGSINTQNTPTSSSGLTEEVKLAYAARDGQERLPDHIMNQMKELKNKGRAKKSRSSKNK